MAKLAASEASTFIAHQVSRNSDAGQIEGLSIVVWGGLSLCSRRMWPPILLLLVAAMYWSCFMTALLITSAFVVRSRHEMPRIVRRQQRWKTSSLCAIMAVLFHVS